MPSISARLLLSKSDYEGPYQTYPDATGRFKDALEFLYFTIFRNTGRVYQPTKSEPILNGVKVAPECKHPIHPTDNTGSSYCPVCEVQICLDYLEALSKAMKPCREPHLRRSWRSARLQLEKCLEMREQDEEEEIEWEMKNMNVDVSEIYTAAKAVRLGRKETRYCGVLILSSKYTTTYPTKKKNMGMKNKTVSFRPNTSFLPSRLDTDYQRSNSEYKPGLHAASEDDELDDASFMQNNLFNLAQMKVYVTKDVDIFNSWEEDPDDLPEESEGIARHHQLWDSIKAFLNELIESDSFLIRNDFQEQCADHIVIAVQIDAERDKVMRVCLLKTEDDWDDDEKNRNENWTSWKEVMTT